jgi:DNA-binding CsgD family transcriptional regulator
VVFDAGAAQNAGKTLYMCRHQGRSPAATYADIAERHDLDTALQEKYDLRWLTYYVDKEAGTSFCLAEAPSREAVEACHREAHGDMLPYRVVEVDAAMIGVFLGDLMTPDPGYPWAESPFRTILTCDLANATDLAVQFGDAAALRALQDFEGLVRYACDAGRGGEVQRSASRVVASFPSASRAVESALTVLEAVSIHNAESKSPPLEVRIGLSAGEPLAEDGELFGAAVQLAATVCSTAPPGSIYVTGVVRDLCVGKALEFIDLGAMEVEGFGGVRLYQVDSAKRSAPRGLRYPDGLTEREVEVLRLIASGKSNHQIAEALVISANTVARHVANIFNKTGAGNRTEAAAYAYRERLA